ncbi:sodium:calcium antiporter [bacterium]|nr:sodium:calcium antiporter [bacterium]MCI0680443.1 sodium:calcium antiporter [bacterium]
MINNIFILIASLFLVARGATFATKYAALLADSFGFSKYTVGFIVVAIISILPEIFIAINSAIEGVPSFALGVLLGSNVADLSLLFFIIIMIAGRGIKVNSAILKNNRIYPFLLLLPIALGLDGHFSQTEGIALIIAGAAFYYMAFRSGSAHAKKISNNGGRLKNFGFLFVGIAGLILGAHFTVTSATDLALLFGIKPIVIGMFVVALGTTIPELFFALKSVKKKDDSLAVGDLLGTVLADATIVIGILALLKPFAFPPTIIYVAGLFMVGAAILLFQFMRSGHIISKTEGYFLFFYWIIFVIVEFIVNQGSFISPH